MIAFLSGTVFKKDLRAIILEVNGIGYRVACTLETIATVQEKEKILLYTHHYIREEEEALFGFRTEDDLHFFDKLISVSGIGPKTALDILEVPIRLISAAIVNGDVEFLKSLKGIGRKTAERMIVELKGNLPLTVPESGSAIPVEVVQALSDLGFDRLTIQKGFGEAKNVPGKPEEMVRWFLQKHGA